MNGELLICLFSDKKDKIRQLASSVLQKVRAERSLVLEQQQGKGQRQIDSCNVRKKSRRMTGTFPDGGMTQDFTDSQGHLL